MNLKPRSTKNNGRWVWCVDLRGRKLASVRKTLKRNRLFFAEKREAETAARTLQIEVDNHGARALNLTEEDRTQFLAAKERLAAVGASIAEAVELFLKIGPVRENKSVAFAVEQLIQDRRTNGKRERYLKQLSSTLNQFKEEHGEKLCSDVLLQDVKTWLNGNDWEAKTRRGKLTDVRTLFSFAKQHGWTSTTPCPSPSEITLDDKPPGILSVSQCSELLKTAQNFYPSLVPYLSLCLFAGIRPEEASKMVWQDVDLEGGLAEVRADVAKTRKRRLVKLSENCIAWLKLGGDLPPVNLKRKFEGVRSKAKIEEWPHDAMRHSFASYHLARHGSADKTATEMGHYSTDMLFRHYRELVKPKEAEHFWNLMPAASEAKKIIEVPFTAAG